MRKGLILLLLFLLLLAGPTAVRYLRFYDLNPASRPTPLPYDPVNIGEVPTPSSTKFEDEPEVGEGLVLLDFAHENNFTMEDIAYLDGRLAARGVELRPYTGGDLSLALRTVKAYLVITPLNEFTIEETLAVTEFVEQGGRLLLIGDPTRFAIIFDEEDPFGQPAAIEADQIPLNSLANQFDIIFNGDYLYNTVENEGNFRNIILRDDGFSEGSLTDNIRKLAFYSSHSLQVGPSGNSLITADENTWSSTTDRPGDLTVAAATQQGRVLALGDIHFLTQPYFAVYDNSRFIAQIADFLTEATDRQIVLADFPYFFGTPVNLVYTGGPELGPDAFDEIIALQEAFSRVDRELSLMAEAESKTDVLYLGLYNQAADVADTLAANEISLTIDPPIEEPTPLPTADVEETIDEEETAVRVIESQLGSIQMGGTALILLTTDGRQHEVIVLAASSQGLENTVGRLINLIPIDAESALSDCLLQENLALCPSNVAGEIVDFELDTSGTPDLPEEVPEELPGEDGVIGDEEIDIQVDAIPQGNISVGETVTGTLQESESHSWFFVEGPATIDIVLSGEEIDGVLALYGPDEELILIADEGISGEDEQLLAVEIPDDGEYMIVVSDFFGRSMDYTLMVKLSAE